MLCLYDFVFITVFCKFNYTMSSCRPAFVDFRGTPIIGMLLYLMKSLMCFILFLSPVSVLMVIALNSPLGMFLISVSLRSLAMTLYYSFI